MRKIFKKKKKFLFKTSTWLLQVYQDKNPGKKEINKPTKNSNLRTKKEIIFLKMKFKIKS